MEDSPPGWRAKVLYLCMGGGGGEGGWFVGELCGLAPGLLLRWVGGGVRVDARRVSLRGGHNYTGGGRERGE